MESNFLKDSNMPNSLILFALHAGLGAMSGQTKNFFPTAQGCRLFQWQHLCKGLNRSVLGGG